MSVKYLGDDGWLESCGGKRWRRVKVGVVGGRQRQRHEHVDADGRCEWKSWEVEFDVYNAEFDLLQRPGWREGRGCRQARSGKETGKENEMRSKR